MKNYLSLSVPGPTITALSKPFWDAASEGKLLIQQCTVCHKGVFYPRPICPHCWQDALQWSEARGQGVIISFSTIYTPGHSGWLPVVPYNIGLVRIFEGPTLLSHILMHGQKLKIGSRVEFSSTQVGERVLPFFKSALE
jgi:hypothetical protein